MITYHSFAFTRLGVGSEFRDFYPISEDDFTDSVNSSIEYTRGHAIDYMDTAGLWDSDKAAGRGGIMRIKSISTFDPRNFIPEPFKSEWGATIRKNEVQLIRKKRGAYAQYMYYNMFPPRTVLQYVS